VTIRLPVEALARLVAQALERAGMAPAQAGPVAAGLAACERDGVRGHGLLRLPALVNSLRIGWADGQAVAAVIDERPAALTVDARRGFVQPVIAAQRERLMRMARATGAALLLTRNSHHFSALWPDIEPFAEQGFVALACVNSKKRMAAWGGGRPVTGTNAMGFAAPRPNVPPLVWDQSSSIVSQGDVLLAAQRGHAVPPGVGCDADGQPTTDPKAILEGGALLPFGGPKGASLAVMVEVLAAALTGASFAFEDASPAGTATTSLGGHFLLLVDPAAGFGARMEALCAALADAGNDRLPGDRRHAARRDSLAHGVPLDPTSHATLLQLAGDALP